MTEDEARAEELRAMEEKTATAKRKHESEYHHLEAQMAEARRLGLTDTDEYRQGLKAMEMSRRVMAAEHSAPQSGAAGEKIDLDVLKAWGESIFNYDPRH